MKRSPAELGKEVAIVFLPFGLHVVVLMNWSNPSIFLDYKSTKVLNLIFWTQHSVMQGISIVEWRQYCYVASDSLVAHESFAVE